MMRNTQEKRGLADDAYFELREAIISGKFMPNERLIEVDLARSFGVGRAAIRTALAQLEQEGLVARERNRGARVRLVSEAEAVEIIEARAALEGLAVRHSAKNASEDDVTELRSILGELQQRYEADDLLGYSDMNSVLHRKLIQIANHATASRLIDMLNSQNVRFQYRTILIPGRPERSLKEHAAIVEAVAIGDAYAAEAAMRTHLSQVAEALQGIDRKM
jgi:DNA-binding GntR family transcriptional regulator